MRSTTALSERLLRKFHVSRVYRTAAYAVLGLLVVLLFKTRADAQYFGRNEVTYETYNFRVMPTDHFDVYFYPDKYSEDARTARDAARMAERWYARQGALLNHSFTAKKPIILYENQTDFHQTNIISNLGEGTGGVTEALKSRLIMPLTGRYADTDHVMGHEMVHEFQYDIAMQGRGMRGIQDMSRLPLWMIEGMAEYLSTGPTDPQTALWLRDALLRDALPSQRDLTRRMQQYFPYRWGHAFWAYLGGREGDDIVGQLFRGSLERGPQAAIDSLLGISPDSLFREWHASIRESYGDELEGRARPSEVGTRLLAPEISKTRMNLAPSVSPNGDYVVYISEESLFSIDLFLADARTGERIRRLTSTESEGHFNALRFIDSAGSWSPDSEQFVFVVFNKGRNELAFLDVESRRITRQIRIRGVDEISNPTWSPEDDRIAFSGISGGQSDLYIHDLTTGETEQLTDDLYADLQPSWAPNGQSLAFTTDRGPQTDFDQLTYGEMQIAIMNVENRSIRRLNLFPDGKHIDPQYGPKGRDLYFVSNQDGFSDIYRVSLATNQISRVTRIATGVHGITDLSPVLSVGAEDGRLVFSVFENGGYNIHALEASEARGQAVATSARSSAQFGMLPPPTDAEPQRVRTYLSQPKEGLPPTDVAYDIVPYRPRLQLDYITGSGGVNIGSSGFASDRFGVGGGLFMSFSDMLGDHQLATTIFANGTYKDLGGQAYYLNQRGRLQWGGVVGHVPYLTSYTVYGDEVVDIGDGNPRRQSYIGQLRERIYVDQAYGLISYPFSTTRRWELTGGYTRYGFDRVLYQYFLDFGGERQVDVPSPSALHFVQASTALVEDRSYFGFTSPIMGRRSRVEIEPTAGSLQYVTTLADTRNYIFTRPVTWATRALFIGRFGPDADNPRAQDYYIGYGGLVRGYSTFTFDPEECSAFSVRCPTFERLQGSRALVANAEARVPLLGTEQFGLLNFPYLPTELVGFVDGGVAWTGNSSPSWTFDRRSNERIPVFSTGAGVRMNIMGYLVMHVYYAYPFQRPDKGGHWWVTLGPGW